MIRVKTSPNPFIVGLTILASLRLTVVLLGMSIFLVFVGTLAQIDGGIWTIVSKYFRSWFVLIPVQLFWQLGEVFLGLDHRLIPGVIPFPGGWTLGALLMANLVAAHAVRFRLKWKRAGVLVLHTGLIILMLGELITGLSQVEAKMTIGKNETVNFIENSRKVELAIIDTSGTKEFVEYTVPEHMLKNQSKIQAAELPFDVVVQEYMTNSDLMQVSAASESTITSKMGMTYQIVKQTEAAGVDSNAHEDAPAVRLELKRKGTDEVVAAKTVTLWCSSNFTRRLPIFQFPPQEFQADGKTWRIELRGRREYLPFALKLNEFRFDRYAGTNTPRNYSSNVTLTDPRTGANREVLIRMNEPLAYDGATYYQSGFTPDERGTVLQVTHNPGVWLPYISCTMIVFGMLLHFGQKLAHFLTTTVRT
jgi:hypothetical protein